MCGKEMPNSKKKKKKKKRKEKYVRDPFSNSFQCCRILSCKETESNLREKSHPTMWKPPAGQLFNATRLSLSLPLVHTKYNVSNIFEARTGLFSPRVQPNNLLHSDHPPIKYNLWSRWLEKIQPWKSVILVPRCYRDASAGTIL
jgi:hypothetical protein